MRTASRLRDGVEAEGRAVSDSEVGRRKGTRQCDFELASIAFKGRAVCRIID